ncbi:glycerate kinase [Chitinophaga pendula]|uniref:glycerate kinase type-2 family protein n=1 Tax=Chitinophaga TaxID=79328 RepID=UPI000BAF8457|nr:MULTISPECIES: glycerate kinase [Chitinophaga]ASZ11135.1 glycerate kinase [Chitinophaga sp. MD30]UCJ05868.1 glycerate kinase [Chitinophaga pendula]
MFTGTDHAITIFKAGVAAVQPASLIREYIRPAEDGLWVGKRHFSLSRTGRLIIAGAGKAAAAMAQAVETLLPAHACEGMVITKYNHSLPLSRVRVVEAGHPVPDENGLAATQALLQLISSATEQDLVLFLLSGGASALLTDLPEGSSLADMQQLSQLLLKSGADIQEMNVVRKHLSRVKGGQLALAAYPAPICSIILSDVVGDDLAVIGSGPTVPDPSTFAEAIMLLARYGILHHTPAPIITYLERGISGAIPETPKPGDERFVHVYNVLAGSNQVALTAAAAKARSMGYHTEVLSSTATGDAHVLAKQLVQTATSYQGPLPACLLMGGESTVQVKGEGMGGRNQQLALAAGIALPAGASFVVLSAGTDGTDGPTDAAGALVHAALMENAAQQGLDAAAYLADNDAYHFFDKAGGLIKTGPTQTNVMDLMLVLIPH